MGGIDWASGVHIYTGGARSFRGRADVCRIRVDADVTMISKGAFKGCANLREVDLANVNAIHPYAFAECCRLTTVKIDGNKRLIIGVGAFSGCRSLRRIDLPKYCFIRSGAFECCSLSTVKLRSGIQTIDKDAFRSEEIEIPSPSFVISSVGIGLRSVRLGVVSPNKTQTVVSSYMQPRNPTKYFMVANTKVDAILDINWLSYAEKLRQIHLYFELKEATTILELAIWKAKISDSMAATDGWVEERKICHERARIDRRRQCHADSKAHIILPLVMSFFRDGVLLDF